MTSWNWVYITDFSSNLKPTYLPFHDPGEFYYYFDSSKRGTCYIAPERFYEPDSDIHKMKDGLEFYKQDGSITEAMDVFSAGCVIAELFMEGIPLFNYSQLVKYRSRPNEIDLNSHLAAVKDANIKVGIFSVIKASLTSHIQSLILRMIDLDPKLRPTFDNLLENARGNAFPESFYSFLHGYVSTVCELSSPSPFSRFAPSPPAAPSADVTTQPHVPIPSDSDKRMELIWSEFYSVLPHLVNEEVSLPIAPPQLQLQARALHVRPK